MRDDEKHCDGRGDFLSPLAAPGSGGEFRLLHPGPAVWLVGCCAPLGATGDEVTSARKSASPNGTSTVRCSSGRCIA